MKYFPVFWPAIFLVVFGCSQKESFNSRTIITGQLENSEAEEIDIFIGDELSSFVIHEDGSFLISFDSPDPNIYAFRADRTFFSFFLSPGDSIHVTTNANDFLNTFKLSGDKVVENTYLFEKNKIYLESDIMELMQKDKESYFEGKNVFFTKQKEHFEKLKSENRIHPDFLKMEEAYFEFEPILLDIQYPNYQSYFNQISIEEVDFPVEETKAKLAEIDLERTDLLNARSYTSIIESIINEKSFEMINQDTSFHGDPDGYEKAAFLVIENLIKNQSVKDYFLYKQVKSVLEFKGPLHAKTSIDKFMAEHQSPNLEAKLKKDLEKWSHLMPGKEIPDFSFEDVSGKPVQLSDLKGTLVYIDIWATWCKPCIAEHPFWDELMEEYKDKPVSFLTISIDDSKEPWIEMLNDKNMGGLQWFAENAWKSEIARHFMVNSIPRFLLLDKEGKIIDPSAERPSGDIRTHLNQFL
jgi:thiol-disulfide isomerase/thioredoxin